MRAPTIVAVLFVVTACTKERQAPPPVAPQPDVSEETTDEEAAEEVAKDDLRPTADDGSSYKAPPAYEVELDPRCTNVHVHFEVLIARSPQADQPRAGREEASDGEFCLSLNRARYRCVMAASDLEAATKCLQKAKDTQCEAQVQLFYEHHARHREAEGKKPFSPSAIRSHVLTMCRSHDTHADHLCKYNASTFEEWNSCGVYDWVSP